jgi:hypothetical protein
MSDVGPGRNRDCSAAAGLRILELIWPVASIILRKTCHKTHSRTCSRRLSVPFHRFRGWSLGFISWRVRPGSNENLEIWTPLCQRSLTSVKREIHRPTTTETLITSLCTQTERTKWKWKVGEVWCGEGFRSTTGIAMKVCYWQDTTGEEGFLVHAQSVMDCVVSFESIGIAGIAEGRKDER